MLRNKQKLLAAYKDISYLSGTISDTSFAAEALLREDFTGDYDEQFTLAEEAPMLADMSTALAELQDLIKRQQMANKGLCFVTGTAEHSNDPPPITPAIA